MYIIDVPTCNMEDFDTEFGTRDMAIHEAKRWAKKVDCAVLVLDNSERGTCRYRVGQAFPDGEFVWAYKIKQPYSY